MSADGKIADYGRSPARFGSTADQTHLETQVAQADAVLFGAGTLRAYGTTMSVREQSLRSARTKRGQLPQPIQMVCSPSGNLDAEATFFHQPVPRWLLTSPMGAERWQGCDVFEQLWILPNHEDGQINWQAVGRSLHEQGVQRLAVLGGGQLTAALLEARLVDELWLTVCPLLLGSTKAPTPVDGSGFLAAQAPQLELLSSHVVEHECFLHYRVC